MTRLNLGSLALCGCAIFIWQLLQGPRATPSTTKGEARVGPEQTKPAGYSKMEALERAPLGAWVPGEIQELKIQVDLDLIPDQGK